MNKILKVDQLSFNSEGHVVHHTTAPSVDER